MSIEQLIENFSKFTADELGKHLAKRKAEDAALQALWRAVTNREREQRRETKFDEALRQATG
jgi:hypothetical protein